MDSDAAILRYVRRARWRAAATSGVATALSLTVLALAAYLVALLLVPGTHPEVALGLCAAVATGSCAAMWRQRVRIADLDARADLREGLATYWQYRRRPDGTAMRAWLAREVAARLARLPLAQAAGPSGRRALRRLAYLVPLLLALLLLRLVWPFGLRSGDRLGTEAPTPSAGPGDAAGGTTPPPPGGADASPPMPEAGAPPPREDDTAGDGPAIPSRPLHLPVREEFVVPTFMAEGPTTTGQGREVIQEVAPPSGTNAGATDAAPVPEPPEVTFQRALERALRARHLPPVERRIVERYFRALAEGGK